MTAEACRVIATIVLSLLVGHFCYAAGKDMMRRKYADEMAALRRRNRVLHDEVARTRARLETVQRMGRVTHG